MTEQIERVLKAGKIDPAKILLDEYFKEQDKASWLKEQKEAYDILYPTTRKPTDEEREKQYSEWASLVDENVFTFEEFSITIDYSEDENYMTFEEYLNETKVVKEEILDDVGNVLEPEVTEKLREFNPKDNSNRIEEYIEPYLKELLKTKKKNAIKNIEVTTSTDKTFYADPESRTDLSDAISIMKEQNINEYLWKTANGLMVVTLDEMIEARTLGLLKKGEIVGVTNA